MTDHRPLSGYRVIELAGIGPGPYAGQLMADMGAELIMVERPATTGGLGMRINSVDMRGKKSVVIDLRKPEGADLVLKLVKSADVLIEGNRPGVTERLGVGPAQCRAVNPKLVYGRMTGWGQDGPWAGMAGHDINYLAITGALNAIGEAGRPPTPPLNLVGDYGGGSLFLVMGILSALLQAEKTGKGDVVDAAIIDGTSSMMGIIHSLSSIGLWAPERESNLLDGAAPYYRCYETKDEKFMAVGCIEPQFFALMLEMLNIEASAFGPQHDQNQWDAQIQTLGQAFKSKTRDQWAEVFDLSDACVTPVLDYVEAQNHPHNQARHSHKTQGRLTHPRSAPLFQSSEPVTGVALPKAGAHTREVLTGIGLSDAQIDDLINQNVIGD